MGSFSWNKADELTDIENIAEGYPFKFLIPKEFGGGYIKDVYQDFGNLGTKENGEPKYDMFELLAFWNGAKYLVYDEEEYPNMKEIDSFTDSNRSKGTSIGCYNSEIRRLKYPLKLVSASFKGTYEDLNTCSLRDPHQGSGVRKRGVYKKEDNTMLNHVHGVSIAEWIDNNVLIGSESEEKYGRVVDGGIFKMLFKIEELGIVSDIFANKEGFMEHDKNKEADFYNALSKWILDAIEQKLNK